MNREDIEIKLIEYNEYHFKKVYSLKVCNNKIFRRLNEDSIRDKIKDRMLEYKECYD